MGIGDFGVGAHGNAYTYNTTEFLGNFSWTHLDLDGSSGTSFTDQLNVVVQFVQHGVTYAYWIQDVAFMDSSNNELLFENNIWNFSSPAGCLDNSGVQGNGTVYPYSGCQGFYAVSPSSSLPGSSLAMPNPGDFGLLVRSYVNSHGLPEVAFEYWDGVTSWYVTYDNVVFPWAAGISADNGFVVDGATLNPLGLYYDAELTIGGPGGGSATEAYPTTDIASRLLYWNGHNFEAPPSVWNFGSNTAEAVSNVQSYFAHDAAGLPETVQLNGTLRNATPAQAYDQLAVGELAVSAPGIAQGTLAIDGDHFAFVNDSATVSLVPGTYFVWVNSTGGDHALGACLVTADATVDATVANGCGPLVSTPATARPSADVGQPVSFSTTVLSAGSGGDTFTWSTSPSGLGCSASTTTTLDCTPTATGAYSVSVTIEDSMSRTDTSASLSFPVDPDPAVAAPTANVGSVETGGSVTFSASPTGGALPYSFAWSGLPAPCTGTTTATPTCTPSTAAGYAISVAATDANGYAVTSPMLDYTVAQGPAIGTPTASPSPTLDVGQTVELSTSASGGSGGYAYTWVGLPAGCTSTSSESIACAPTAAGPFAISVHVKDSNGGSATSVALALQVDSALVAPSVTVTPTSIDVGQAWAAHAVGESGGSGIYTYAWTGLPSGCASANASALACVPTGAGAGSVELTVTDSLGSSVGASAAFAVFSDPTIAGLSASRASADFGQSVTFTAAGLAGGSGNATFVWSGLPSGCAPATGGTVTCTITASGTDLVLVNVTDSNGFSVRASVMFVGDSAPSVGPPAASPTTTVRGSSVTFSVEASGGAGPYSYAWTGLPSGCVAANASSILCTPGAAGTWTISVTVTDANGLTATSTSLSFTTTSPPSATFLGLPAEEGYALLGVGIVVVIGGAVALLRRRSRGP
jgi:hypothetical protein